MFRWYRRLRPGPAPGPSRPGAFLFQPGIRTRPHLPLALPALPSFCPPRPAPPAASPQVPGAGQAWASDCRASPPPGRFFPRAPLESPTHPLFRPSCIVAGAGIPALFLFTRSLPLFFPCFRRGAGDPALHPLDPPVPRVVHFRHEKSRAFRPGLWMCCLRRCRG